MSILRLSPYLLGLSGLSIRENGNVLNSEKITRPSYKQITHHCPALCQYLADRLQRPVAPLKPGLYAHVRRLRSYLFLHIVHWLHNTIVQFWSLWLQITCRRLNKSAWPPVRLIDADLALVSRLLRSLGKGLGTRLASNRWPCRWRPLRVQHVMFMFLASARAHF